MDNKKQKIMSEWKTIDKILSINPKKLSETYRQKYYAYKSLLIKESEYLRSASGIIDYTANMLTENVKFNINLLMEDTEARLQELCKKNKKIAKVISEASVNNKKKLLEAKLETLLIGDILEHLVESKQTPDNLGFMISSEMLSGYIRSLVEFTDTIKK